MRPFLVLGLAVLSLAPVGCRASKPAPGRVERPAEYDSALRMEIRDYRVVWTRGGRQGYLQTFAVSEPQGPTVTMHHVLDNDFRQMGWIANDGQAERYEYPPTRVGEAKRTTFDRIALPVDSLENQVRRILGIEPTAELALTPAGDQDLKKQ